MEQILWILTFVMLSTSVIFPILFWIETRKNNRYQQVRLTNENTYTRALLRSIDSRSYLHSQSIPKANSADDKKVFINLIIRLSSYVTGYEHSKLTLLFRISGLEHSNIRFIRWCTHRSQALRLCVYRNIAPSKRNISVITSLMNSRDRYVRCYSLLALLNRSDGHIANILLHYKYPLTLFEQTLICSMFRGRPIVLSEIEALFLSPNQSVVELAIRMTRFFAYSVTNEELINRIRRDPRPAIRLEALETTLLLGLEGIEHISLQSIPELDMASRKRIYRHIVINNLLRRTAINTLYELERDNSLRWYLIHLYRNQQINLNRTNLVKN